jgi:hypothetical protein
MIMNVVPPTRIDLSKVQVNQTMTIPLASYINVSNAKEASLLVKVMSASFSGTGNAPTFSIQLLPTVPTEESQVYGSTTSVVSAGPGNQTAPSAPSLHTGTNVGASPTALGGWVSVVLVYTQYQTAVTSATINFSVDLVLKT